MTDSLLTGDDDRYKQRVEHWNPAHYDYLGPELYFFNNYLRVVGLVARTDASQVCVHVCECACARA